MISLHVQVGYMIIVIVCRKMSDSKAPVTQMLTKQRIILIGTRESLFSLSSWLAIYLPLHICVSTMTTSRNEGDTTCILRLIGWWRQSALAYSIHLWASMLWSIDTCQIKESSDQYHVTISWVLV